MPDRKLAKQPPEALDPVSVLTEKQTMINRLIDSGLACAIYLETDNGKRVSVTRHPGEDNALVTERDLSSKKLAGIIIQISDNEVISTNYNNMQMQVIECGDELAKTDSNLIQSLTIGSNTINVTHQNLSELAEGNLTPLKMLRNVAVNFGLSTIVANAANNPELVTEKLSEGIKWLQKKQEQNLRNRTQTTAKFNQIIGGLLKGDGEVSSTDTPKE